MECNTRGRYCCFGMAKSQAVSWAHFHMARTSRVKPISLGFSSPRISRCFMMAINSLLLSSPFPKKKCKWNECEREIWWVIITVSATQLHTLLDSQQNSKHWFSESDAVHTHVCTCSNTPILKCDTVKLICNICCIKTTTQRNTEWSTLEIFHG